MLRFIGQHVSLCRLKKQVTSQHPMKKYLVKKIPPYPSPVEFRVSDVTHVTDEAGLKGILKSEQFRPPKSVFSWWDLKINKEEIKAAEKSYAERHDIKELQESNKQEPFLERFTTSPLFQLKASRYGNYRFTFPLSDLMKWYKEQNCGGEEPVLRTHLTMIYKQQIVYTVLIHSPEENKCFGENPPLEASEWVKYRNGEIIWKAQAICETHQYQFISGKVKKLKDVNKEFYVWDKVSLLYHLPKHTKPCKALTIPRRRLIEALEACELDNINLSGSFQNRAERNSEAKMKASELKRELEEDKKENKSKEK